MANPNIEKALKDLAKAIGDTDAKAKVRVIITLEEPKSDKAKPKKK